MRAMTEEFGILLIFDEVKTGFRLAKGGAAEFFGITPDLGTFAKAMGNGYPAAAFGGRREVMSVLPDKVSHGGTYAGNRVAAAAAVKTLEILRDTNALETIHATGRRVQDGLREVLNPTGIPYVFTGHPSMFGIMFTDEVPTEYRDWAKSDHELYDAVALGMLARGAMPEPDSREPWFMCEAHAEGDTVDQVVSIFEESLHAALEGRAHGDVADARHGRDEPSRGRLSRPIRHPAARHRPVGPATRTRDNRSMVLDGNAVRSVDRAAALLLALGDSQGEAGVTELARRLGLHKSTASRLLATLQKRGLVEQDEETGKYRLGLVIIRLAERAERTLDLRGIAMPELERLARLTHETTGLGILDGDTLLTVAQADGPNLIAVGDWTGPLDAAPLRRVGQGPAVRRRRAGGPPDRPARPRQLHRADDHRARAAPRGAGPDPPPRLRDRARRVRDGPERGRRPGPRRARQRDRRGRHLGPGLPPDPAPDPGARGPGARGRGRDLGPPRRHGHRDRRPADPRPGAVELVDRRDRAAPLPRRRPRGRPTRRSPPPPDRDRRRSGAAAGARIAGRRSAAATIGRMDFTKPPLSTILEVSARTGSGSS